MEKEIKIFNVLDYKSNIILSSHISEKHAKGNCDYYKRNNRKVKVVPSLLIDDGIGHNIMDYDKNIYYWLNEKQIKKMKEWKDAIKIVFGEYGTYTISFSPTGISDGVEIYSSLSQTTLDLTDFE